MGLYFLFSFAFCSFLFSVICKASSDNHFAFLHFFSLGMDLISASYTMLQISIHSSSGTLSIDLIDSQHWYPYKMAPKLPHPVGISGQHWHLKSISHFKWPVTTTSPPAAVTVQLHRGYHLRGPGSGDHGAFCHWVPQDIHYMCLVTSVMSDSLQPHGPWPARLFRPWDSPGKGTGAGCHFLLQW